jgi:hypothetical protein
MKRLLAIVLSLGMLGILAAPVAAARPASDGLLTNIPVTGSASELLSGDVVGDLIGEFEGMLSVTEIGLDDGVLTVAGTLTGEVTDAAGNVIETITGIAFETTATLANGGMQPRCDILFLDLGPLHLDVLGLVVDLSDIQLDIHAVPGAGNLLGNLLCAVAGLLDGPSPLGNVLNNLLGLINGLLG